MDMKNHWPTIQEVVSNAIGASLHCAIASVAPDGTPHVTPVGTVFIRDDGTGYYFDQYTSALAQNIESNPNVCLMAVNSGAGYWFRSLWRGRFISPPGVRLYGTVGPLRPATPEELRKVNARMRPTMWLKGARMLWSSFTHVRDITFTSFKPVVYPRMMDGLWDDGLQETNGSIAKGGRMHTSQG